MPLEKLPARAVAEVLLQVACKALALVETSSARGRLAEVPRLPCTVQHMLESRSASCSAALLHTLLLLFRVMVSLFFLSSTNPDVSLSLSLSLSLISFFFPLS